LTRCSASTSARGSPVQERPRSTCLAVFGRFARVPVPTAMPSCS
jgi:hypothetical protein